MSSALHDNLLSVAIDDAASGDTTIISATAGRKITIFRLWLWSNGTVTATLKDGASTNLAGPMALVAQNFIKFDHEDDPWFTLTAGNAFIINLGAAIQVSGRVYYSLK